MLRTMSPSQFLRPARLLGLLSLLFAAACAQDPVWSKPSGTAEMFKQDNTACYRGASQQAEQQMRGTGGAPAPLIDARRGQTRIRDTTSDAQNARKLAENAKRNRLYSECMHRLGYRRAE